MCVRIEGEPTLNLMRQIEFQPERVYHDRDLELEPAVE